VRETHSGPTGSRDNRPTPAVPREVPDSESPHEVITGRPVAHSLDSSAQECRMPHKGSAIAVRGGRIAQAHDTKRIERLLREALWA
jgi:hypothetical protein